MEDSIAVSVQNVSKKFRLFGSPKDRLREALHPFKRKYHHEFWALKDITFDVPKGMTLGIIGRNGSGKSTLLQMICSVLTPTSGTLAVNGRISALLELGAGFNPEFTGRDNVILNGALMGFSRSKMEERLPLIDTFADIGEFIDQPVKTYSSGMFVRLAFAAAINVDPDILIVDEALAVGDAKFQHKCYNKFLEFQKSGKTILFVTHDMNAITKHCDNAILLEKGAIVESGEPNEVVNTYINFLENLNPKAVINDLITEKATTGNHVSGISDYKPVQLVIKEFLQDTSYHDNCIHRKSYNKDEYRYGDGRATLLDYLVIGRDHCDVCDIESGSMINIYVKFKFYHAVAYPITGFSIKTIDGVIVYGTNTDFRNEPMKRVNAGEVIIFKFSVKMNLAAGHYFIELGISEMVNGETKVIDRRSDIIHLQVRQMAQFVGLVELESFLEEI